MCYDPIAKSFVIRGGEDVQPIRRRIVEILKENGSATVSELAEQLGMAQVSVRHHLDILMGEDFVEAAGVRRRDGAGRPSQMYALAPAAQKLFPQRYAALAGDVISQMKAALPAAEVRGLFARLAARVAREAPDPGLDQPVEKRLEEVTAFLTDKGYNARWEQRDGHFEIHACNFPYLGVADDHPVLCMMDQMLIEHLVPDAVRRTSRALNETAHCVYVLEPKTTKT